MIGFSTRYLLDIVTEDCINKGIDVIKKTVAIARGEKSGPSRQTCGQKNGRTDTQI